jgi:hypothetical protein
MALLIGLGGRTVAAEIAAGRAWRTVLVPGDRIRVSGIGRAEIDAVVVEVRPTAVELDCAGRSLFVLNSELLQVIVERVRSDEG